MKLHYTLEHSALQLKKCDSHARSGRRRGSGDHENALLCAFSKRRISQTGSHSRLPRQ